MTDAECAAFLKWALPRAGLHWPGFRRVRRQVCKRLARRLRALRLPGLASYRARLESDPGEWTVFDSLCHITISRFWRDRAVFDRLAAELLPEAAARAEHERRAVAAWSAGCASGEEPYSLSLAWESAAARRFPGVSFTILATDVDEAVLARARAARFSGGSLREVPAGLRRAFFAPEDGAYRVCEAVRARVRIRRQDIRRTMPRGPFDLILCRNLVFTYFAPELQRHLLAKMLARLREGGLLLLGVQERLPPGDFPLVPVPGVEAVYRKTQAAMLA